MIHILYVGNLGQVSRHFTGISCIFYNSLFIFLLFPFSYIIIIILFPLLPFPLPWLAPVPFVSIAGARCSAAFFDELSVSILRVECPQSLCVSSNSDLTNNYSRAQLLQGKPLYGTKYQVGSVRAYSESVVIEEMETWKKIKSKKKKKVSSR